MKNYKIWKTNDESILKNVPNMNKLYCFFYLHLRPVLIRKILDYLMSAYQFVALKC